MTSTTASIHATCHVRVAAYLLGTQFLLPLCLKREVTERPERALGGHRLPVNTG